MSKLNGSTMNNPWLSSNPAAIPIAYADHIWDEAFSNADETRPYKTQAEINQDFLSRLNSLSGSGLSVSIVDALPEVGAAQEHVIYLVKVVGDTDENNYYDEYIYLPASEDASIPAHFELIGSTKIDLSGYATKQEVSEVTTRVQALEDADYVKSTDLDTKVGEAGYIKSDALADYAQTSDLDPFVSSASLVEQDNPSVSAHNLAIPIASSVRTEGDAVDTRLATEKAVADVILSALSGYGVKSITISPSDPLLSVQDTSGALTISSSLSAELSEANHLIITGNNETQIADIDMSEFVVDGMLDSVTLETQEGSGAWGDAGTYMHFVFNADSGSKEIWLNVTKLLDAITYNLVANASDTSTLINAQTTQTTQSRTMTLTLGVMTTAAQYQQPLGEGEDRFVTMRGLQDVFSTVAISGAHLDDGATGVDLTVSGQKIQIPIATTISGAPEGTKLATESAVKTAIDSIPEASSSAAGLMSADMFNKLSGVAESATADSALSSEEILAAIAAAEV